VKTAKARRTGRVLWLRVRLAARARLGDVQWMLLWAAAAGLAGSLATVAFREAISGLLWLMTHEHLGLVDTARRLPWWQRLLFPCAGGLVAGIVLQRGMHLGRRQSSGDYMEAIVLGDGNISARQTLVKSISSLLSIASGGSIGREGSMVQLSAMLASLTGRLARFTAPRRRLLVACGAAAGMSSAYNAPIAGALFVAEIVLGSIAMESFGPLIVASVVASITIHQLLGYRPTYEVPAFDFPIGWGLGLYLVLGFLAGALAPQFLRLLDATRNAFARINAPAAVKLGLGGLVVGVISVHRPEVWGNGYSVVNSILHSDWAWLLLLELLVFKVLATAATAGSGAVGGVFTPTLFVGAALGSLFGHVVQVVLPAAGADSSAYAAVGMGCFLAATTHAPFMAILMIFEMTLSHQIVLPLMLACVVAYYTSRIYREDSIYGASLRRKRSEQPPPSFESMRVNDLLKPDPPRVMRDADFDAIAQAFSAHRIQYLYVTGPQDSFCGVIALEDVKPLLAEPERARNTTAAGLLRTQFPVLTPQMPLSEAVPLFASHRGERLPVVAADEQRRLLGAVAKSDLMLMLYERLQRPEMHAAQ
jgi:CIC family chloride channel protein